MLIIADIVGQLDALERLVARIPEDEEIVLVGDLVDRGPYSAEVIEWAMKTPRVTALMGNHEHMMLDYYTDNEFYENDIWQMNGGHATMLSYDRMFGDTTPPQRHLEWLKALPRYKIIGDNECLVTHAPIESYSLDELKADPNNLNLLWNRYKPIERNYFQVFGHNSH